jgi:hypothetical protein
MANFVWRNVAIQKRVVIPDCCVADGSGRFWRVRDVCAH